MNLKNLLLLMVVALMTTLLSSCSSLNTETNSSIAAVVVTNDKGAAALSEQHYTAQLKNGQSRWRMAIKADAQRTGSPPVVVSVAVLQANDPTKSDVIETGDSVSVGGFYAGNDIKRTLDVSLAAGEYEILLNGSPTASRITILAEGQPLPTSTVAIKEGDKPCPIDGCG